MATFTVTFIGNREDEDVVAESYRDSPPFVDFITPDPGLGPIVVARYRAEDIRRILRKPSA